MARNAFLCAHLPLRNYTYCLPLSHFTSANMVIWYLESICWFVSRITQKATGGFGWNFYGRLDWLRLEGLEYDVQILQHCQIGETSAEYGAATWRTRRKNWHSVGTDLRSVADLLVVVWTAGKLRSSRRWVCSEGEGCLQRSATAQGLLGLRTDELREFVDNDWCVQWNDAERNVPCVRTKDLQTTEVTMQPATNHSVPCFTYCVVLEK